MTNKMKPQQHNINDVVYVLPYEGWATIIGVTDELDLVVRWYNSDAEQFTAIVEQSNCIGGDQIDGLS